jgi:hypothetical protein
MERPPQSAITFVATPSGLEEKKLIKVSQLIVLIFLRQADSIVNGIFK